MTRLVMGNNWILAPALLLMLAGLVCYFVGLHKLKRRMAGLQPLRPVLRWVPGFANWARDYDSALALQYQAIFLDAGLAPEAAAKAAALHAGNISPGDHRLQLLESAAGLGRLREELAEQLERDRQSTLERFERPRNIVVILIRAIVYIIVGTCVMAMYLPIFKIGATV
jgi:type II secretory pathway component PulF